MNQVRNLAILGVALAIAAIVLGAAVTWVSAGGRSCTHGVAVDARATLVHGRPVRVTSGYERACQR